MVLMFCFPTQTPWHKNFPFALTLSLLAVLSPGAIAQSFSVGNRPAQAPPPATPLQRITPMPGDAGAQPKPLGTIPYSIGQPTDEEQLYVEYLNRMRGGPAAEGQRLASTTDPTVLAAYDQFQVDLSLMESEFATNPPVPPLAVNAELTAAARWHSGDMYTNQYQGHFQNNGSVVMSPGDRISTNGYKASGYGENVFSYAESVFHGHAAFAVDWGTNMGGMQIPPGHRENMLNSFFREVGVGVVDGVNGSVGPQLVTQDFGTQFSSPAFITGVVYFDLNGNGFYDLGEGIGGVTVNTPGSTYFAVTADSGGYVLPVAANGNYTVTFTASGLSNQAVVAISSLQNTKLDYSPAYSPPSISGPNPATLNQNNTYNFTPVPAATGYQWRQAQLQRYTVVEGAENGLGNVSVVSSPGYSVISSDFAATGTHSFNLQHVAPVDQSITLNPVLLVQSDSQLSFSELLAYALSNEVAEAQVSIDSGASWQTVWSKAGNDGNSMVDSAFVHQAIPLGAYAGNPLQVRFVYALPGGFHFEGGTDVGLYLDNIGVSDAQQMINFSTNMVASGSSFSFVPSGGSNYLLQVRAQINTRTLPWGPIFPVTVSTTAAAPAIALVSAPTVSGGQVQVQFSVTNYRAGMSFELLKSADVKGPWVQDAGAKLDTLVPNARFQFTTTTGSAQVFFFKVKGI